MAHHITATVDVDGSDSRAALGVLGAFLTRWSQDPATAPNFVSYPEASSLHHCAIDTPDEGVRFEP